MRKPGKRAFRTAPPVGECRAAPSLAVIKAFASILQTERVARAWAEQQRELADERVAFMANKV